MELLRRSRLLVFHIHTCIDGIGARGLVVFVVAVVVIAFDVRAIVVVIIRAPVEFSEVLCRPSGAQVRRVKLAKGGERAASDDAGGRGAAERRGGEVALVVDHGVRAREGVGLMSWSLVAAVVVIGVVVMIVVIVVMEETAVSTAAVAVDVVVIVVVVDGDGRNGEMA